MTVEPRLTYLGESTAIDPDATYSITYEIRGDESGPVIDTAELSDHTSLNSAPSVIQTGLVAHEGVGEDHGRHAAG
ncbi:hypothetical protein ABZ461_39140 [Actinacidiphila glaucinigra]|uniref:hypothetical protein n=1 Tax=Actinacidiphila glaucinigra TaxID=235986 RepID=UPI0033FF0D5E